MSALQPIGPPTVEFTVAGNAVPGGTVRPVPIRRGGEVIGSRLAPGRDKEGERRISSWLDHVASAASQVMGARELLAGPVVVHMEFFRPRLGSHYGTGKNAGKLKGSAPTHPITRPDLGKLERLVEDGMSGTVYRDDSQIVCKGSMKRWGPARCEVRVWEITEATVGQQLPEAA